jgi:hypothetical protein
MFYDSNKQKERGRKMNQKRLKKLKETKEEKRMLKNKKRNNINSFGCNNSSALDISRSKYKLNTR